MRVTKTTTPRERPDMKSIRRSTSTTEIAHQSGKCRRCGGFLVDDHSMDLDIRHSEGLFSLWAMRCVQCGDMIDEAILRNRHFPNYILQEDLLSAKGGGDPSLLYDAPPTVMKYAASHSLTRGWEKDRCDGSSIGDSLDEAEIYGVINAQPFLPLPSELEEDAVDVHVRMRTGSHGRSREVQAVGNQSHRKPEASVQPSKK